MRFKVICITMLMFLFFSLPKGFGAVEFHELEVPRDENWTCIATYGENNVWLCGGSSKYVLRSSNGGELWEELIPEEKIFSFAAFKDSSWESVYPIDESLIYLAGQTIYSSTNMEEYPGEYTTSGWNARIIVSSNGGETWGRIPSIGSVGDRFISMSFLNSCVGIAVGKCYISEHGPLAMNTKNCGQSWEQLNLPLAPDTDWDPGYYDVVYRENKTSWIVGGSGTILRQDPLEGGLRYTPWRIVSTPDDFNRALSGIDVSENGNHICIARSDGRVMNSMDGGDTWDIVEVVDNRDTLLYDVCFQDINNGWVCGARGTLYETNDGGYTWVRCHHPFSEMASLRKLAVVPGRKVYVCGDEGVAVAMEEIPALPDIAIPRDECGGCSEDVSTELSIPPVDNTPPNVSFINPTPEEYEAIEFHSDITVAIAAGDPGPMDDPSLFIRGSVSGLSIVIISMSNDIGDPDESSWEPLCQFTGPWETGLANRAECDINVDFCCGHYRLRAVAYDKAGNRASADRIINIVLPDPEPSSGGGGGFTPPYSPYIPMPFPPFSSPAFSTPQFPYFSPSGLGTGGISGFGLGFNQGLSSNFGIGRGSLILGNMSFAAPQGLAFGGGLSGWTTPMFGAGFSLGSPSTFGIGRGNSIIGNLPITTPQNPNFGGAFSSLTTPILGAGFNPVSVSNYGGNQFVWDSSFMGLQGSTLGGAPSSLTLLPLGAEGFVPLNSISPAL